MSKAFLSEAAKYSDKIMDIIKGILDKNDIQYKVIDSLNLIANSHKAQSVTGDQVKALVAENVGCDIVTLDALINIVDVDKKIYIRQILK